MTNEAWIGILTATMALLNGVWAFVMRGVRAELRTMRAEVTAQFNLVTTKIDLHVLDRLNRVEHEVETLRQQHADSQTSAREAHTAHELLAQRVHSLEGGK